MTDEKNAEIDVKNKEHEDKLTAEMNDVRKKAKAEKDKKKKIKPVS